MRLEVRIPISPTAAFFNQCRLIARSVRTLCNDNDVEVLVSMGGEEGDIASMLKDVWKADGCRAYYRYVSDAEFAKWQHTKWPWVATMLDRYQPPFTGDYVLMVDADVIPIRPFPELFNLATPNRLLGVMAHISPFGAQHVEAWRYLYSRLELPEPRFSHELSGWRTMGGPSHSPPYFNGGMVFGRREVFEHLYSYYYEALEMLRKTVDTSFYDQIGLALGAASAGIEMHALPMRWNFANQPDFDEAFADELADVRFIHAMRTNVINRSTDLGSEDGMRRFLLRHDLMGSNEILRQRVAELLA